MRRVPLFAVALAALALSAVHWLGLLVGGIAVGLLARTWPRALAGGAAFGLLAWVAFLVVLWNVARLGAYWQSGQLLYVSLGTPIVLGTLGALSHAFRPASLGAPSTTGERRA
ncbi:DUF1440 domain-containing protein [Halobacterium zhouii]|uniref:DUF1440 domain-containing protein n=1 Tax=Halobacterium zhouii TaxID=2902624 RepID=UPI001E464D0A|nr:DUF1440 domain-containing protein [Halobacterium zhouii]